MPSYRGVTAALVRPRPRDLSRLRWTWIRAAACVFIAAAAVVGLLRLQTLQDEAHQAEQLIVRLELETARLHSWDRRVVLGQTGPDELPTIQARAVAMTQAGAELSRVASNEPEAMQLVRAMA